MSSYSKSHERDESRKMKKGIRNSILGLLLCWLPVVGLLLAIAGFFRLVVRITDAHRHQQRFFVCISVVVLFACMGVFSWECWYAVNHPGWPDTLGHAAWQLVTGEKAYPWEDSYTDGDPDEEASEGDEIDLSLYEYPDEYYTDDGDSEGDFDDSELMGFEEDETEEAPADYETFLLMRDSLREDPLSSLPEPKMPDAP